MSYKTLTFRVKKTHPDFSVAQRDCWEARIIRNSVNAVLRAQYFHYRFGSDASLKIPQEYGLSVGDLKPEYVRQVVEQHLNLKLKQKVSQGVIRLLRESWSSLYSLRKKGYISSIPGYVKQYAVAPYNSQALSKKALKEGFIIPSGWRQGFRLPRDFHGEIKYAKVVPDGNAFTLHVSYKPIEEVIEYTPVKGLIAGIDPGVNNLFTIAFNDFRKGMIINGKPLKHINHHYNILTSQLPKGKRRDNLWAKRNRKMKHYYQTATNVVVKNLCEAGVETVVIGWNEGIKDKSPMSRRNNKHFVQVPTKKILLDLAYKLKEKGINVVFTEESYTSKASFLDHDPLPTYPEKPPKFSGRRVKRGLYKSSYGRLINADLNGALNIIRKYDPEFTEPQGTGPVVSRVKFTW